MTNEKATSGEKFIAFLLVVLGFLLFQLRLSLLELPAGQYVRIRVYPASPHQRPARTGSPAGPPPVVGGEGKWIALLPKDVWREVIEVGSIKAAAGDPYRRLTLGA